YSAHTASLGRCPQTHPLPPLSLPPLHLVHRLPASPLHDSQRASERKRLSVVQASEIPERPSRRSGLIQLHRLQSTVSSSRLLSELLTSCDRLRSSCFIPPSAIRR